MKKEIRHSCEVEGALAGALGRCGLWHRTYENTGRR